jgi:PAS domain S-box-containing protein
VTKTPDPHKILARISSYFIGDFILDEAIRKTLAELGRLASADRAYLYRIHHKAKLAHVTHEWLNPANPGISGTTASFALGDFKWLTGQMKERDMLQVGRLSDLPAEASNEKKTLRKQKVRSFIIFPLHIKEKLEGYIGLDYLVDTYDLNADRIETLKIAIDIIGFSFERKLNESSLRKTQWLYESIFENTGAATLIIRPDTGITMVNSEFERLSGYIRKEVEGKIRFIDLVGKKNQSIFRQYHHLMISNPDAAPRNYEFEFMTKKGETRTAFMMGSSLLDTRNCLISFIDISEFRETERQLILARDRAEESDRLKSAFLANVSHEIRTPLNAITGFAALLSNPNLHLDKREKYIQQILNGSNELISLIDNVLDLSRADSGTLIPRISEFPLNPVLEETLGFYQDYKHQHQKENLDIRLKIPGNTKKLLVRTDRMRLKQILANILENAFKFTTSGTIEFGYSISGDKGNGFNLPGLLFYVKDSGIGIAKKDREKVFERFVKIVEKDDQLYPGAGLGLAVAKELVQLLGGKIWLESRLGKGSTFYFTIPHKLHEPVKDGKKTPARSIPGDWSDKTIMVAEDTESNFRYIEEILGSMNCRIIRARNGKEAIELFQAGKDEIDLIFMDILMPECDGFEATREIHKIRKDIPVVAQTAFTFEGELSDGLYAGCFNDYILKPFNIKTIRDIMEKYLFTG